MDSEKATECSRKKKQSTNTRMKLVLQKNLLKVPTMGTSISIITVSKTGTRKLLPLIYSKATKKFLAIFDEPQVDLEVSIDNSLSPQNMHFSLELQKSLSRFEVDRHSFGTLQNVEQRKLQIVPQSSEEGQASISAFAKTEGTTYQTAAQVMSQMTFYVSYAKRDPKSLYTIQIHDIWRAKKFCIQVVKEDTVERVKLQIQDEIQIPPAEQKLVYQGKVLLDDMILHNCKIIQDSKLSLLTSDVETVLTPIGSVDDSSRGIAPRAASDQLTTQLKNYKDRGTDCIERFGERGIVILKEDQCQPYRFRRFECDRNTRVRPVVVEFRYSNNNS